MEGSFVNQVQRGFGCLGRSGTRRCPAPPSEPDLPDPDVLVHDLIAHEAVQRPLERRGPVLLEPEVPDPRERVAAQQADEHEAPRLRRQRISQAQQPQRRADEVQPPAGPVAVLAEVEQDRTRRSCAWPSRGRRSGPNPGARGQGAGAHGRLPGAALAGRLRRLRSSPYGAQTSAAFNAFNIPSGASVIE